MEAARPIRAPRRRPAATRWRRRSPRSSGCPRPKVAAALEAFRPDGAPAAAPRRRHGPGRHHPARRHHDPGRRERRGRGDLMRRDRTMGRRELLAGRAASGLGLLWAASRHGLVEPTRAAAVAEQAGASCTLSRELTEGPYWIDTNLTRRDITEDRPGVPLRIVFTVQDASTCRVIRGADVELWHADAARRVLRLRRRGTARATCAGTRRRAPHGRAVFDTIYPGWYRGRTPHIHLKVHVGGDAVHTGQLFFRDALSAAVYRTRTTAPAAPPRRPTRRTASTSAGSRLAVRRRRGGGYIGRMTLNVEALIACPPRSLPPRASASPPGRGAPPDPPAGRRRDPRRVRARMGRDRVRRLDGRAPPRPPRRPRGRATSVRDRQSSSRRRRRRHHRPVLTAMDTEHLFWITSRAAGRRRRCSRPAPPSTLGLLMGGRMARGRTAQLRVAHEALSLATLAALVVHAGALLGDGYLSPSLADITIPFASGYEPLWTSTGIVAGWLLLLLGLSYYARGRIGAARWRRAAPLDRAGLAAGRRPRADGGHGRGHALVPRRGRRRRRCPPLALLAVRLAAPPGRRSRMSAASGRAVRLLRRDLRGPGRRRRRPRPPRRPRAGSCSPGTTASPASGPAASCRGSTPTRATAVPASPEHARARRGGRDGRARAPAGSSTARSPREIAAAGYRVDAPARPAAAGARAPPRARAAAPAGPSPRARAGGTRRRRPGGRRRAPPARRRARRRRARQGPVRRPRSPPRSPAARASSSTAPATCASAGAASRARSASPSPFERRRRCTRSRSRPAAVATSGISRAQLARPGRASRAPPARPGHGRAGVHRRRPGHRARADRARGRGPRQGGAAQRPGRARPAWLPHGGVVVLDDGEQLLIATRG